MKMLLLFGMMTALGLACDSRADEIHEKDFEFALEEIEKNCGHFFKQKKIDWRAVSKEFTAKAKEVSGDEEHLVLLTKLLARVKDGHAAVRPLDKGKGVKWPEQPAKTGPGMFWCVAKGKVIVKNSWSSAKSAGVAPGMEVVKIDKQPAREWLDARIAELAETTGFSTPQQAQFYACHRGLSDEVGKELKLELRSVRGRRERIEVRYTKANPVPWGPAFYPKPKGEFSRAGNGDLNYAITEDGWGYIQVRRCKGNLPQQMDEALAKVGGAPGIILDFRGNSGGGFDHDAFMGRFVPKGKTIRLGGKGYVSAGPLPYGGPVVVIVDATCRSAGETAAGIFKEDGRAYMIGESPTAGMSSSKKTINLPSGLFSLYVSVYSNKKRFNKGAGIEGVGVIPHETVEFDPKDLAEEKDTLILNAEELLKKFPQRKVPYDPKKYRWKPGQKPAEDDGFDRA